MLAKLRRSMKEKDEGFTLIELLVVIIIIGILAGIAIPLFLSQRKKATESSVKSDLRALANAMETYSVDHQSYPAIPTTSGSVTIGESVVSLSQDNSVATYAGNESTGVRAGTFCLMAANTPGGDLTGLSSDDVTYYDSDMGGIQPKGTGCGNPTTPQPQPTN